MPTVRKLTPDQVQALQNKGKGPRRLVEEQYDALLSGYELGDYGEAELEPDENRLTVRNRLRAAAERRGLQIEFKRTIGRLLRFSIQGHDGAHAAPVEVAPPALATSRSEPTTTTQRKGRTKKEA